LGGQIRIVPLEYLHAFVAQRVDKIQATNEKIGNANKKEVVVIKKVSRIPYNHENATGNNDREHLGKTVKKEVIVKAAEI
jgi:inner membrane protein involved in colicin E2 resistance